MLKKPRNATLDTLAATILIWVLKGFCLGVGAYVAWRVCHAGLSM